MTNNVTPIRNMTMAEETRVMTKLVALGESMLAFAKTPAQLARMEAKVETMRQKLRDQIEQQARLENGHG